MDDKVSLHSYSPTFPQALESLQQHPAEKFRFISSPEDTLYAAQAWKRLFIIALKRMHKRQPQLARLTAIEALKVFSKTVASSSQHASAADLREVEQELEEISERSLRGATTPRQEGLPPEILVHRYRDATAFFRQGLNDGRGIDEAALRSLWQRWGGGALPKIIRADGDPCDLLRKLQSEPNPHESSILLLATSLRSTKASIRNALSRAGALSIRPGYCPGCKVKRLAEKEDVCSLCFTTAAGKWWREQVQSMKDQPVRNAAESEACQEDTLSEYVQNGITLGWENEEICKRIGVSTLFVDKIRGQMKKANGRGTPTVARRRARTSRQR